MHQGIILLVQLLIRTVAMYFLGVVAATLGAGMLIGALTFVTLLVTVIIFAMILLTASPILNKVFKEG